MAHVLEGSVLLHDETPVSRQVRAYDRATGALVSSAMSDASGFFSLDVPDTSLKFLTAFDNDLNAVIADKVVGMVEPTVRFWQLVTTNTVSGLATSIAELILTDSSDVDYTTTIGGVASANSIYSNQTPNLAFDRNANTFWGTNGTVFPNWLRFALNSPIAITKFSIRARNDATWRNQTPTEFHLQSSKHGDHFTTVGTFTSPGPWAASEVRTFTL